MRDDATAPSRSALAPAPRARVVDEVTLHGAPVDFRELCVRAVPASTRTLLLDLDRTVHLGRNMGELLGWEIHAHRVYGPEHCRAIDGLRGAGRFAIDWTHPAALVRYAALGTRTWGLPGLYYLLWGKIAWNNRIVRRWSFTRLGPEPVREAQRVPQAALMHQMADLPLSTLRDLTDRVWRRHEREQVVLREDVAWLRRRCPHLRIVLTSASPQPVVEVAGERLGVDDVVYSGIEATGGWLSAPAWRSPVVHPSAAPRRISPPAELRINAGRAKLDEIERRFPEALASEAESVGVSDTGYGEDHSWAQRLACVVDVNSTAPFPPIVDATSPLRAIHSAVVLTRAEREARERGGAWLDPRRHGVPLHAPVRIGRETLAAVLAGDLAETDVLLARIAEASRGCADAAATARRWLRDVDRRVAAAVDAHNEARSPGDRADALARLDALDRDAARAREALARALRPVSDATRALVDTLEQAQAQVASLAGGHEHAAREVGAHA